MKLSVGSSIWALAGLMVVGATSANAADQGPIRMARISYVSGTIDWRPDSGEGWTRANLNQPLRQGAQLWARHGRVEIQFDDGSSARFANGAVVTLTTLYSDNQGEFTELKLSEGTSSFRLKDKYSIYQIDDPDNSIKSVGPSQFRVEANGAVACGVRQGDVTLTADGKDTVVPAGDRVVMNAPSDPVELRTIGSEDTWDQFNDQRVAVLAEPPAHVPENIALVSGGLDHHGHWHFVAGVGWAWAPTEPVGWRPYHEGHWAWVDPFGWTWVSNDPWGWAPYHYGTWSHTGYGWAWVPGPAVQYWSPAVVDFCDSNGYITWAPLAPAEVSYPAFSVGFHTGNWWFNFSIGGCAVYQPFGTGYCGPVAYPALAFGPGYRHGWDPGWWQDHRFGRSRYDFVPRNAQFGAVGVSEHGFVAGGRYDVVNRNAASIFRNRPQAVANRYAYSGPVGVRPNAHSFSPSRAVYASRGPAALNRPVQRAALSARVTRGMRSVAMRSSGPVRAGRAVTGGRSVARPTMRAAGTRTQPANRITAARQSLGFHGRAGANYAAGRRAATRPTTAGRTAGRTAARTAHPSVTRTQGRRPTNGRSQNSRSVARSNARNTSHTRSMTRSSNRGRTQPISHGNRTHANRTQPMNRGNRGGQPHQSNRGNRGGSPQPANRGNRGGGGGSHGGGNNNRGGGGGNRGGGGGNHGNGHDRGH